MATTDRTAVPAPGMYTSKMGPELEGLDDEGVPMGVLELPLFHHDIHREASALLGPVLRPHTVSQTYP